MQDHRYLCLQSAYQTWSNTFWLSFLLQPSLLSISVATNWLDLLRFANREQFQTHLSATHPHGMLQLKSNIKHIHSTRVHPSLHLMACWHVVHNTWTTLRVVSGTPQSKERGKKKMTCLEWHYFLISWQTYGLRESNQKSSREESREESPLPLYTVALLPAHSLPSALHRSAYVVTNDTFIFLQRLCVCKTAEVHQDVKYLGWATQVALEDNQMEV